MKILFATTNPFLPLLYGGTEVSTNDLAIWCQKSGVEAAVLSSLDSSKSLSAYKFRLTARFSSERLATDTRYGYSVLRCWEPATRVVDVIERKGFDLAVLQGGDSKALARALIAKGHRPLIFLRDLSFRYGEREKDILDNSSFISNSNFTADVFWRQTGLTAPVIPPLVHRDDYETEARGAEVLFVNPTDGKGLGVVLALAERCPDIPFTFVQGWGVSEADIKAESRRTAALKNVTWVASTSDMRGLYARARIVIAPTGATFGAQAPITEAWGRVATEAQISGIPVLATDMGGFPQSVGRGGVLVNPQADIDVWVHALRKLWDDQAFYDLCSAEAFARSQRPEIQSENLAAKFLDVCRDVVALKSKENVQSDEQHYVAATA